MRSRLVIIAMLAALLGPLLVSGANHLLDAAFQRDAAGVVPPADPEKLSPEGCAPPLPAALDNALRAIVPGGPYDRGVSDDMAALFQADQAVRAAPPADPAQVDAGDLRRREQVLGYLLAGQVQTTRDLVYAAFIFQHGNCPEHYLLANRLAQIALEAGDPEARWIYAAALDRYQMSQGQPQKYGTQYTLVDGRYELYPIDPATTDAERAQYGVPPLAVAQARAGTMPVGGAVVRRVLLSWWLTWAGLGYALLGAVAIALARRPGPGRLALAAAALVYLLSIAGHAAEILWLDRARLPLQVALGLAAAGLLALGLAVVIRPRRAPS